MNLFSVLSLLAFIATLYFAVNVIRLDSKASLNRIVFLIYISFDIWAFCNIFIYSGTDHNALIFWYKVSSIGISVFPALILTFFISLTSGKKKTNPLLALLYVPSVILFYKFQTGIVIGKDFIPGRFGNSEVVAAESIWFWVFAFYMVSYVSVGLFLCAKWGYQSKVARERKQAFILTLFGALALPLGGVSNMVLPGLQIYILPSLGPIAIFVWYLGVWIAMAKYGLLVLTPEYISKDIIKIMRESLLLLDTEEKVILSNSSFNELFGYSGKELERRGLQELFGLSVKQLKENEHSGEPVVLPSKSKNNIPVNYSVTEIRDDSKDPIGTVIILRDLTQEMTMKQAEEQSVRELEKAYGDLEAAQKKLLQSEKLAAVGQLAGGVAHEINNPMTVILGYAQLGLRRIKAEDPLSKALQEIEKEAVRCKVLVNNLLTFSRSAKMQKEKASLNKTIQEALALAQLQAKIKNVKIDVNYDETLPETLIDTNQMQ